MRPSSTARCRSSGASNRTMPAPLPPHSGLHHHRNRSPSAAAASAGGSTTPAAGNGRPSELKSNRQLQRLRRLHPERVRPVTDHPHAELLEMRQDSRAYRGCCGPRRRQVRGRTHPVEDQAGLATVARSSGVVAVTPCVEPLVGRPRRSSSPNRTGGPVLVGMPIVARTSWMIPSGLGLGLVLSAFCRSGFCLLPFAFCLCLLPFAFRLGALMFGGCGGFEPSDNGFAGRRVSPLPTAPTSDPLRGTHSASTRTPHALRGKPDLVVAGLSLGDRLALCACHRRVGRTRLA